MAESSIIVVCGNCQTKNRVPGNHGHIEVTCGKCKRKFVVWSGAKPTSYAPKKDTILKQAMKQNPVANLTPKQQRGLRIAIVVVGIIILGVCADALSNHKSTAYNINKGMGEYIDYVDKTMKTQKAKDNMDALNNLYLPYGKLEYDE